MCKQTNIPCTPNTQRATTSENWYLLTQNVKPDYQREDEEYTPSLASMKTLVNGETAFDMLYEKILHAKSSVDIIIWGFQPSMFFRRKSYKDPNTGQTTEPMCIGDLLIKKALEDNVQVKILVWSMWLGVQTFMEANMGNISGTYKDHVGCGVTEEQMWYDDWWYKVVMRQVSPQELLTFCQTKPHNMNLFGTEIGEPYDRLFRFCKSGNLNLQVKKRSVAMSGRAENAGGFIRGMVFLVSASHHQKTVLIDYEQPDKAVGFVLEHNMLDNYWDTNQHVVAQAEPNTGKNYIGNYQDTSCMVSGEVLWHINHNFCQSWDRWTNIMLPGWFDFTARAKYWENLTEKRSGIKKEVFKPADFGTVSMAQILRTYDLPEREDIRRMYLQNIKKATRYIYTENQYFRWPKLVEEFAENWKKVRCWGRDEPMYWFVITNSTDEGVGSGTEKTNEMLELLGRQDVMPRVAKAENSELDFEYDDKYDKQVEELEKQVEEAKKGCQCSPQEYAELQQKLEEAKARQEQANYEAAQKLRNDMNVPGLRTVIATIVAKDEWQEVYVHSKVTVIDDVFMFIGSANLNLRSMHLDTELGIITECRQVAQDLRQQLWGWHTAKDSEANPPLLDAHKDVENAFMRWEELINKNREGKRYGNKPTHPLCGFFRLSPEVTKSD